MRKAIRSPLLALGLIVAFAGTVLATAGTANFGPPVTVARGTLSESVHYNTGAVKFQTKGAVDFVTQTIDIGVGASSGWHAHPGVVLVTVKTGRLVRYDENCSGTEYGPGAAAGSAFTESGDDAGVVRNESASPASVYVTFLVPAGTTVLRINKDNPGCPQT